MNNLRFIILKWFARLAALASLFFLILFIISDLSYVSRCGFNEILLFIFFPFGVIVGLIVGLKFELIGSITAIFALFSYYLLHYIVQKSFPSGIAFLVFSSPALLYLISWLINSKKGN